MKPSSSSEHDEQDREVIRLLEELGAFKPAYPPELLTARRAAFLAQVERLTTPDINEELSAGDQEIVHILGNLKSVQAEYPPDLLAARRSALLQQMQQTGAPSVWDELRGSIQRIFQSKTRIPTVSLSGFLRVSLVIGSLIAAFLGSLVFGRTQQASQLFPSRGDTAPTSISTRALPANPGEVTLLICKPDDPTPGCLPGELDPGQDIADAGKGTARPAVSSEAQASPDGVHKAAYVNDGQVGASWVSNRPDGWIKIDLGQVTTINTVSLQQGSSAAPEEDNPGQFVIAVALSDVYTDGDSSNDYMEYAQIFDSEQTGFGGRVSQAETIRTQFSPVQARYVKITFEKAGAAIEEVGVFMTEPPVLAKQPTHTPRGDVPGITLTPTELTTLSPIATATSVSTGLPPDTAVPTSTDTATLADTPTPAPTNTLPPADIATPVPTDPLPTVAPPTAIPPIVQPPPVSTEPIVVTGSDQTLTFTCNGNAAEIRGHANTVTLLGSCSSITVTGNGNHVFWQSGSPVITNRGMDNIILQL
jgi:hypothetical protein